MLHYIIVIIFISRKILFCKNLYYDQYVIHNFNISVVTIYDNIELYLGEQLAKNLKGTVKLISNGILIIQQGHVSSLQELI